MPTGRTDELTRRFGAETAAAITAAYEAAIANRLSEQSILLLDTDQRLALVRILIAEADAGRVDPAHLRGAALVFVARDVRTASETS